MGRFGSTLVKKLNELLKVLGIYSDDCSEIDNITYRIECVNENSLFVGLKREGYVLTEDIQVAKSFGAITLANENADYVYHDCVFAYGMLLEAFHDFPSDSLCVIGVTGTNGKTTVSSYIYQMLRQLDKKVLLIGTNGIYYEDSWEETVNTTPSQEVLAKWLLFAKEQEIEYVVMEVSSIGLHQKRVVGIHFDYVIVTNVTSDHLDYHGSLLEYQLSKYQIFKHLKKYGIAIVNTDDEVIRLWKSQLAVECIEYNEHVIEILQMHARGSLFVYREFLVQTNQVAKCNIYNLCACISVLKYLQFSHKQITTVCKQLDVVVGRFQVVHENPLVVIDYAHTEDALYQILMFYRKIKKGSLFVVFGCGGNRDVSKRAKMGKVACELADVVILTEDNSRTESVENIILDIVMGCNGKEIVIYSREEAIKYALSIMHNNDIIIIAGKGNERFLFKDGLYQPVNDLDIVNGFYIGR